LRFPAKIAGESFNVVDSPHFMGWPSTEFKARDSYKYAAVWIFLCSTNFNEADAYIREAFALPQVSQAKKLLETPEN